MTVEIVDARPEWSTWLLASVRAEQLEEVTAYPNNLLEEQIRQSLVCKVGLVDNVPVVVWGVMSPSITSGIGIIWALVTKHIESHPFVFARMSRIAIEDIRGNFREIIGTVSCDFQVSIKWLRWLGFDIGPRFNFHGVAVRKIEMKGTLR